MPKVQSNLIVCLGAGTFLTDGANDDYANRTDHIDTPIDPTAKIKFPLGFTLGAGWRVHGAGIRQTTVRLHAPLILTAKDNVPGLPPIAGDAWGVVFSTNSDASDNIELSDMVVDLNYPGFKNISAPAFQLMGVQLRSNNGGHNIHDINVINYTSQVGANLAFEAFPIWIYSVWTPFNPALPANAFNATPYLTSKHNQIKYTLLGDAGPMPAGATKIACTGINVSGTQAEVAYNVSNGWSTIANAFGGCQGYGGWDLENTSFHDNFAFNNSTSFLVDSLSSRNVTIEYNEFINPQNYGMVIGGGGRYDYYTIRYNNIDLGGSGSTGMVFQGDVSGADVNHNDITVAGAASGTSGIFFAQARNLLNQGMNFQFNQISSRATNTALPAAANCAFANHNEQENSLADFPDTQTTACAGAPQAFATQQSDGNFVIYGAGNAPLWNTNTFGTNAPLILMQDDGNLVIYQFIWQAGVYKPSPPGSYPTQACNTGLTNTLVAGQFLNPGQCIVSSSGQYMLFMATDGNFFIYDLAANTGTWGPGTQGHNGAYAVMQTNGNLVVYDASSAFLWNSGTTGSGADILRMEDDGRIILYKPVWQSATNHGASSRTLPHPLSTECTDVGPGIGATGVMGPNQCIVSPNGLFEAILGRDGTFTIYDRSATPRLPLWDNELQVNKP